MAILFYHGFKFYLDPKPTKGNYVSAKPAICWVLLKKVLALLMETARRKQVECSSNCSLCRPFEDATRHSSWDVMVDKNPNQARHGDIHPVLGR